MSFTTTPNFLLKYPAVGTEIDDWGDEVGANFPLIDTGMKANADAAAAASTLAGTKAPLVHVHAGADITTGTVAAARLPAFTGDVTAAVGTAVNVIAPASVTNAKLATAPAKTMKGNNTAAIAAIIDMTVAEIQAMIADNFPLTGTPTINGVAISSLEETVDSGGNITIIASHTGKLIRMTGAGTVTFASDAAIAVGSVVNVGRYADGEVTIAGASLRSIGDKKRISDKYGGVSVKK